METPGGLEAHSSAWVLGSHYPRPSRCERCGADNGGGGVSGTAALTRASVLGPLYQAEYLSPMRILVGDL